MKVINAIHINDTDNCVTLAGSADAGDAIRFLEDGVEKTITARERIPIWHKMAVKPIEKRNGVYKYGAVIGIALDDIDIGDHVHVHNICSPGTGG